MNDAVDVRVCLEDIVKSSLVHNVKLEELWSLSANEFNAIDNFLGRIVEIVRENDFVVCFQKSESGERANVAGTAVLATSTCCMGVECTMRAPRHTP